MILIKTLALLFILVVDIILVALLTMWEIYGLIFFLGFINYPLISFINYYKKQTNHNINNPQC